MINLPSIKSFLSDIDSSKSTFLLRNIKIDLYDEDISDLCLSISKFTYDDLNIRFPKTKFYNNIQIFEIEYLQNGLKENFNRKELEQEKLKNITQFLYEESIQLRYKIQDVNRHKIG